MAMYLGIHHCEILVTDMTAALEFYQNKLGLHLLHNPSPFADSKWLKLGNQELHLTPYHESDANEERHFAIQVSNIESIAQNLKDKGIDIIKAGPIPGLKRFFIFDPFGNRIEFIETIERQMPAISNS
jgi:catechol 2,3-dioxygenase-like lactoylglutathione lyase family enzyme